MKILFIIVIIFLSSCKTIPEKEIIYVDKVVEVCTVPDLIKAEIERPKMTMIDGEYCSPDNIEKTIQDTEALLDYIKELETRTKIYERRIKEARKQIEKEK